ncbi:hypothetical protein V8E53_001371, partial [Lactarius tabidus]
DQTESSSGDEATIETKDQCYDDNEGKGEDILEDGDRDNAGSDTAPIIFHGIPVNNDHDGPDLYSDSDEYTDDSGDDDNTSIDSVPISQCDIGLETCHSTGDMNPEEQPSSNMEPGCSSPSHKWMTDSSSKHEPLEDDREFEWVLEGLKSPTIIKYPGGNTGMAHSKTNETENQNYEVKVGSGSPENPYAPFASSLDWQIAKWAKLCGPSLTAFTELMAIDGVQQRLGLLFKNTQELNNLIDTHLPGCPPFQQKEVLVGEEVCMVFYRDIIQCIRVLFADPDLSPHLILAPERHFVDEDGAESIYHDMHTGSWWWTTQAAVEQNMPGTTIVPVLISTEKTQLTPFQNKCTYPIYMTIGNIPKDIRRKTSSRAYVLLGYLPTTKLENETNQAKRQRLLANLYHACMNCILKPLISAGEEGISMSTADGVILTTCSRYGDCPVCGTPHNDLGNFDPDDVPRPCKPEPFLEALDSFWDDSAGFLCRCSDLRMKPVPQPLWLGLPYLNISQSITPGVLHQVYQGIFKQLKAWVLKAWISSLSRVTGHEHDQICRFFLGLLVDIRLPNDLSNIQLLWVVRAMLDFLYLAQYPIHTGSMLRLLAEALSHYHANKDIFISLGLCNHFNIPKFHFISHYVYLIKLFGTTDNFNTQYTERLHIDYTKDTYAATNHKDEFEQMTTWMDRKEHVLCHNQFVNWRLEGAPIRKHADLPVVPHSLTPPRDLTMAKHPSQCSVSLDRLETAYGAMLFKVALCRFISVTNHPNQTRQQLEGSLWGLCLLFTRLPVWHVIKFTQFDPVTCTHSTADTIHAQPARTDKYKQPIPGRFDTAL